MWGALTGKIDAVVGGPPGRSGLLGADRDVKILQLMTRMILVVLSGYNLKETSGNWLQQGSPGCLCDGASLIDLIDYKLRSG